MSDLPDNIVSRTDAEHERERARLRKVARTADSEEERRVAMVELAALDRERHRDIYDKLANE